MRKLAVCLAAVLAIAAGNCYGQEPGAPPRALEEPYGIGLEGFPYPHQVRLFELPGNGEALRMAYMDVRPKAGSNGRTALLLHGRNFPSSYWQGVIEGLTEDGYRVIVPDQIGFNKSSKPASDLHFDQLARNTVALLDRLGVDKVDVVGHSTGGMLAVRLARSYPDRIERIVLAAPIGLEDYRVYVPPVPLEQLMEFEDKVTAESYRKQLMTAYSLSLPPEALDPYVDARIRVKGAADYKRWLRAFANSYLMIWREPVVHEIPRLTQPVLFVMGENDHLAPGRNFAPKAVRDKMGHNARLAQELAGKIKYGRVEVFEGTGHLVHLERPQRFNEVVRSFLDEGR
ncbi:MAG: alpha/beta fold hydrolase [Methyloceanibacter sp.]